MKNILSYSIISILLLTSSLVAEDRLKVGVIAGFSGPWASYGAAFREGLEMSGLHIIADVIYEDDQFTPRKTVTAARKLININKIDLLIIGDSVTATAAMPIAQQYQVPTIAWLTSDTKLKNQTNLLRFWLGPEKETAAMLKFANKIPKGKTVALVSEHPYTIRFGKLVKQARPSATLEELHYDFREFRSLLLKHQADNYFLCLVSGHNGLVIKELSVLGKTPNIFACDFMESKDDLDYLKGVEYQANLFGIKLTKEFLSKLTTSSNLNHFFSVATFYSIGKFIEKLSTFPKDQLKAQFEKITKFDSAFVDTKVIKTEDDYFIDTATTSYLLKNNQLSEVTE